MKIKTALMVFLLFSLHAEAHVFAEAIREGDLDKVNSLISEGYNVRHTENGEDSALLEAIISGHIEIVLTILKAGADPNEFDSSDGKNIKHILSYAVSLSEIIVLLSYGADPHIDYCWEYNSAEAGRRYLHILIYSLWPFGDDSILPPKTVEELNNIIFMFPVLRILSLVKALELGLHGIKPFLCEKDKLFIDKAGVVF